VNSTKILVCTFGQNNFRNKILLGNDVIDNLIQRGKPILFFGHVFLGLPSYPYKIRQSTIYYAGLLGQTNRQPRGSQKSLFFILVIL
jgi:hypothetical protein